MEHRRPTIADVAKRAGVSKGLVSFVFNDRPGVAGPTRARIRAAAAELGWRPDLTARSLAVQRSFALGLVVRRDPTVLAADPFFPAFMAGIETALSTQGQVLVLHWVPDPAAEVLAYRALAEHRRVDGVLLTDLRRDDARLPLLAELGLPAVCIGRPESATTLPVVNLDDAAGIAESVDHLVGLGHERIGYVGGDVAMLHGLRRRTSFVTALRRHGLAPVGLVDTDFSAAQGAAGTAALLDRDDPPTAIVYASDPLAIAGMAVLQRRGVDVPGRCSVTGFDGMELGRHLHPALTTVVADPVAWGRAAADVLLRLITDGRAADLELPAAALELRASTGPPPRHRPAPPRPPPAARQPTPSHRPRPDPTPLARTHPQETPCTDAPAP